MRIIYVNLHTNTFVVQSLAYLIKKQRAIDKQYFIVDWLQKHHIPVVNYITLNGSCVPSKLLRGLTKNLVFRKIESKYVLSKSKLNTSKIEIMTDSSEIKEDDIIIFYDHFPHSQFDFPIGTKGIKIAEHIHFYGEKDVANAFRNLGIQYYMFDVDLSKYSKIYQKNYAWFNGEFIMRPYSYQPRFIAKRAFGDRKMKAVAMGTLTKCAMPDFIEEYGTEYYQPRRKMILDNAAKYPNEIDSYISEYQETALKEIKYNDTRINKFSKKIYNYFHSGQQKAYFSFDMVDKYNEYKMFICPEDIHGSYGVGMVEGMACGCALIGANYGGYEDIGLVAGESYIAYDGTMEDLIKKIRYYQKPENQAELERIAKTGCEYIRKNFSQEVAARQYYEALKTIIEKHRSQKEG